METRQFRRAVVTMLVVAIGLVVAMMSAPGMSAQGAQGRAKK